MTDFWRLRSCAPALAVLVTVALLACSRPGSEQSRLASAGSATALTASQAQAAVNCIRECYSQDAPVQESSNPSVELIVTLDLAGTARMVEVAPASLSTLTTPSLRAFAERARRAALDPQCAQWPLPASVLNGQTHTFTVTFRP